ncbi:SDR family oxidoreductase [Aeromicrobium sp. 9AM]|uniref:SDR family NAD(P)-dependent oxidoreductase n=1 Tax=Aeromicrobium sp. 9AM TaxID=2653126 RepID=UPI0012F34163|nr:SDR family NAD(P)-dependent oxidoreductase [Aeromicrobium sp. 9AM]VXC30894.1 Short-chain dehydrogenase [Aeromicrobium sp. 9AM]
MTSGARVLVVTGASSGIGRAVALQSAAAGDHVVLVARGEPPLQQVARECEAAGAASTLVLPTDVGDDAEVEKLVTAVTSQHGRIDAVVNCAGVVAYGRTEEVPVDVFEGVLRTNLTGAVNVARHVIPVLRRQREGSLVLFGSVIGHISVPGMSAYVLSKWGVRALARQLQLENRDLSDVTIAYVAPGGVDTPIYEQAANYDGFAGRPPPPVLSPERVARIALRRLDNHRARTQVGVANDLMRFGFNAVPWAFDMLVGPLFRVMASDRTTRVEPTEGNVLESHFAGNRLHGAQGNALIGLGRNVVARLTGKDSPA